MGSRFMYRILFTLTAIHSILAATPVYKAVKRNNIKEMSHILEKDQNAITQRDTDGYTPLHLAARAGYEDIARRLLLELHQYPNKEKHINLQTPEGRTALHLAITNGHTPIVKLLVANGAAVGKRAIDLAIEYGYEDMVSGLRFASLMQATENANIKRINEIITQYPTTMTQMTSNLIDYGFSPLHVAAEEGYTDVMQRFINAGANINIHTSKGNQNTPLHKAVQYGHKKIVEILIHHGANLNATNKNHVTPLGKAITTDNLDIARLLLKAGAHVNIANEYGMTPLHWAAQQGDTEMVQLLLSYDAKINAQTRREHFTPLQMAINNKHTKTARVLINNGADVTLTDHTGGTALHYAARAGTVDIARKLLQADADVNAQSQDGATPLHTATGKGQEKIIKLLLQNGAKVTPINGMTPLEIARKKGFTQIATMLQKYTR